jgi:hypothetical protein
MVPLTDATWQKIRALFPETQHEAVARLLESRCGSNLPLCQNTTPERSERIRFAVLKLSQGSLAQLQAAVDLANADWRDILVAAGFGHDITAHRRWFPS